MDKRSIVDQIKCNRRLDLQDLNLTGVKLTDLDLENANFSHSDLSHTDLSYTYLKDANFHDTNLQHVNFRNAILDNANFDGADIRLCMGNGKEIITMFLGNWIIVMTKHQIAIGCEQYPAITWASFNDEEIHNMDNLQALTFWKKYKEIILNTWEVSFK